MDIDWRTIFILAKSKNHYFAVLNYHNSTIKTFNLKSLLYSHFIPLVAGRRSCFCYVKVCSSRRSCVLVSLSHKIEYKLSYFCTTRVVIVFFGWWVCICYFAKNRACGSAVKICSKKHEERTLFPLQVNVGHNLQSTMFLDLTFRNVYMFIVVDS